MQHQTQGSPKPFHAHAVALQAAGLVLRISVNVPAPLKSVADQALRAAASVPLNLAEGSGRKGRDRMHHWRIAYGSALEVGSALSLLISAGATDPPQALEAQQLFDRVRAMTWRLMHPAR